MDGPLKNLLVVDTKTNERKYKDIFFNIIIPLYYYFIGVLNVTS